jgi:hypothetical protein
VAGNSWSELKPVALAGAASVGVLAGLLMLHPRLTPRWDPGRSPLPDRVVLHSAGSFEGRTSVESSAPDARAFEARSIDPDEWPTPSNSEELRLLVASLRALPHDRLLRMSNAEFDFEDSRIVEILQELGGDWVVAELGKLAVGETDPLLKAVLVAGLCKGAGKERLGDPRMLEQIGLLLPQLSTATDDVFHAGRFVVFGAFCACLCQKADYPALVLPALEGADNPDVLLRGYMFLGRSPGAEDLLASVVREHANPEARFGALEGLRDAAMKGRIPPQDLASIGLDALRKESSARNRVLLLEMVATAGGEEGMHALESMVAHGAPGLAGPAASLIAVRMEPDHAQEILEHALASATLTAEDRASVYQALGAVPDGRGLARLLRTMNDAELPDRERLDALRGLWNGPVDAKLRGALTDILESDQPGALRAESMRLLAFSDEGSSIDARSVAEGDPDPLVRKEAVLLRALEPSTDTKGWLEERFLSDDSGDVREAALGAMVVQARYTGDSDAARDLLDRVKRTTNDPEVQALVSRGEQMLGEYDPRRIDLELRRDAEFYRDIARFTTGAARVGMERQAAYLQRMVDAIASLQAAR